MSFSDRFKTRKAIVALSAGTHFAAQFTRTIVALITIPLLLKYLDKEIFGLWMIALSLVALIGFAQGAVSTAFINNFSNSKSTQDVTDKLVSAFYINFMISVVSLIFVFTLAFVIPWRNIYNIAAMNEVEVSQLIFVVLAAFAVSFICQLPKFFFIGNFQAPIGHIIEICATILSGIAAISAIYYRQPLWVIALFMTVIRQILCLIIGMAFIFKQFNLNWRYNKNSFNETRELILRDGGLLLIIQCAFALGTHTDLTLIGIFSNVSNAGDYAIVQKIFSLPIMLALFVNFALWPAFARAKADGDIDWIKRIFLRNIVILAVFSCLFSVIVGLNFDWILQVWLNQDLKISPWLIWGMMAWLIVVTPSKTVATLIKSQGAFKTLATLAVFMVLINIPISIYLIKLIGEPGAVWGTVVSYILAYIIPYLFIVPGILSRPKSTATY